MDLIPGSVFEGICAPGTEDDPIWLLSPADLAVLAESHPRVEVTSAVGHRIPLPSRSEIDALPTAIHNGDTGWGPSVVTALGMSSADLIALTEDKIAAKAITDCADRVRHLRGSATK